MPPAARALVRLALLHLLAGAAIGATLLAAKGAPGLAVLGWEWRGAHVEMLLVGFLVQLPIGVAAWILPRDHDRPPGQALPWISCALLNGGVACAALGAVTGAPPSIAAGRALQSVAVLVFVAHAAPRVRGVRDLLSGASSARSR